MYSSALSSLESHEWSLFSSVSYPWLRPLFDSFYSKKKMNTWENLRWWTNVWQEMSRIQSSSGRISGIHEFERDITLNLAVFVTEAFVMSHQHKYVWFNPDLLYDCAVLCHLPSFRSIFISFKKKWCSIETKNISRSIYAYFSRYSLCQAIEMTK